MDLASLRAQFLKTIPFKFTTSHRIDVTTGEVRLPDEWRAAGEPLSDEHGIQRQALDKLRELREAGLTGVCCVAEQMPYGGNRYCLVTWPVLYDTLCALEARDRHFYAITLEWFAINGQPLTLDIDVKFFTNRAMFLAVLRKIIEIVGAPCIVVDACSPAGLKQSAHIMSRHVAFRTTAEAREYALELQRVVLTWIRHTYPNECAEEERFLTADLMAKRYPGMNPASVVLTADDSKAIESAKCKWIDEGIPKSRGLYKLPGNIKCEVGRRGQRPNNALDPNLPPLPGNERYADIFSWREFYQYRPWLSESEASAAHWPMVLTEPLPPPRARLSPKSHREYYETQFDWSSVLKWGTSLQLRTIDLEDNTPSFSHVRAFTSAEEVRAVFLRPGTRTPLSIHVYPDMERWLVFDLDLRKHPRYGECKTRHSRFDVCDVCMALAEVELHRLRGVMGVPPALAYYTGSNGIHAWYELTTLEQRRTFSRREARRLFYSHVIKPLCEAWGGDELQAGTADQFVRVPRCLHDSTSRPPRVLVLH